VGETTGTRRRRPRGAVRDGLVAAGLELARTGGPDAVVLREATRMVGVVPNAAYRYFADRDELLAAVCAAALRELADRMAAGIARVRGKHGDPAAARRRLHAVGTAYLAFAREEPGLFASAFALPQGHAYAAPDDATGAPRTPLGHLRAVLDELVDADVLSPRRRDGIEYPIWSTVHGLAVLTGQGPPARRPRHRAASPPATSPQLHRRQPGLSLLRRHLARPCRCGRPEMGRRGTTSGCNVRTPWHRARR